MKVNLKKMHENAELPKKTKKGDLCYDVVAVSEEEVAPNVWRYKLGFAYEIVRNEPTIPDNWTISVDLRCRSGIWKTGMILANAEGTLDEFYRGEAMAVFYHVLPNMPRYKVGDRVGQIKLGFSVPIEFEWADEIDMDTERGTDGFHSSGRK